MKKLIKIIFFGLIFCSQMQANNKLISAVSFGPVELGEHRIPIELRDFRVHSQQNDPRLKSGLVRESIQWVRTINNLLTPRARFGIQIHDDNSDFHIKYNGQTLIPVRKTNYLYIEIYINLFSPGNLHIFEGEEKIETLTISAKAKKQNQQTHVIDFSCANYQVKVEGLENEYLSLGCRMERLGRWKKGKPRLEITWASTNLRLPDGTSPPYITYFHDSSPLEFDLVDQNGNAKTIKIKATLPKRLRRLKTAWGLGPYPFKIQNEQVSQETRVTPALFLYGKLDVTEDTSTSFKFFNGLLYNGTSLFNNAGLYFSYELATALDHRVLINPLLGAQLLSTKIDSGFATQTDAIYPQGFEIVYRHAFDIENYNIVFGVFLPFSESDKYNNVWLRWGKGYFWELNYISWDSEGRKANTYGLSIGLPLANFF